MPDLTAQEIAALRAWPRMLALAFVRGADGKGRITFQEFCDAQDAFEATLRRIAS
jgi:hypothetical protein